MTTSAPAFWRRTRPSFPARPPTSYAAHDLLLFTNGARRARTCQWASRSVSAGLFLAPLWCLSFITEGSAEPLQHQHKPVFSTWPWSKNYKTLCHEDSHTHSWTSRSAFPLASRFFASYPWRVLVVCPWSRPLASMLFSLLICKVGMIAALTP